MNQGFFTASGRIEDRSFNLSGTSVDQIYNRCVDFVLSSNIIQADEIFVSINNERRERYTTAGWWKTPISMCNVMLKTL